MGAFDILFDNPLSPISQATKGPRAVGHDLLNKNATIGSLLADAGCPDTAGVIQTDNGQISVDSIRQFWIATFRAESGGDAKAKNLGGRVVGIAQIDSKAHNEDPKKLEDPVYNLAVAKRVSKNWTDASPWDAVTNGAYKRYNKPDNDIEVKNYNSPGTGVNDLMGNINSVGDGVDAVGDGINAIAKAIEDVVAALFDPNTYYRLGKGLAGGVVMLLGLWALYSAYAGGGKPKIPVGPKVPVK